MSLQAVLLGEIHVPPLRSLNAECFVLAVFAYSQWNQPVANACVGVVASHDPTQSFRDEWSIQGTKRTGFRFSERSASRRKRSCRTNNGARSVDLLGQAPGSKGLSVPGCRGSSRKQCPFRWRWAEQYFIFGPGSKRVFCDGTQPRTCQDFMPGYLRRLRGPQDFSKKRQMFQKRAERFGGKRAFLGRTG